MLGPRFPSQGVVGRAVSKLSKLRPALPLQKSLASRVSKHIPSRLVASGAGGGSNGSTGGGGGGGGGKGDNNGDGSKEPQGSKGGGFPGLAALMKGWEERVQYDAEFPIKVFIEQVIGVGMSVVGDMSSRPNWGLNELDFVFSTLVVGSILNFTVMFTLAPTAAVASASAAGGNFLQKAMSDHYLKRWGAPGGNCFEPGSFTAGQRLVNFGYKGVVFAGIGFLAGILGTSLTNGLLIMRKNLDPNYKSVNEPPNIIYNAGTWGLHMGLSSNLRYQALGGTDRILVTVMPIALFRVYQTFIRGLNNVIGGISFVTLARILGVQKSGVAVAEA